MDVFVLFTILLLCLAKPSTAAPTDNTGSLAITGSSDAWASLVANVVPLLILVGEKHVKAYFKCISQPSQLFLYAASPIGLVTAIVTMIRLGNSALMKRLIGRQFESRAEVLADVSSISGGTVGFELRGSRRILEQTIDPKVNDEAHFWIQGRMFGTGNEGLDFGAKVEAVVQKVAKSWVGVGNLGALERYRNRYVNAFMIALWKFESRFRDLGECPYEVNHTVTSWKIGATEHTNESRTYEGTVLTVFDASGEDAQDLARSHAARFATYGSRRRRHVHAGIKHAVCKSRSLAYLSWRDVSETLTANANVKYQTLRISRNLVALVCVLANVTITTLNWFATQSIMNTTFISLGLAASSLTSFWTAVLVSRSTSQETVSMEGIHPIRAGFRSVNFPRGVKLDYCPKQVVFSVERDMTSQNLALERHDWITPASVFLTAPAFILLYLGLRAAEWWVPFAMFGNVAFATFMRATLTTDSPMSTTDLYKAPGLQWCPNPFSHAEHNWLFHIWQDLRSSPDESTLHQHQIKRQGSLVPDGAADPTKGGTETQPVREGPEVNSPNRSPLNRSPSSTEYKQESETKLIDACSWSEGCWTILSTCDKGGRSHPAPTGQTVGVKEFPSLDGFMQSVYEIEAEVERRKLVVTESKLGGRLGQDESTLGLPWPEVEFVRSEFISRKGIWQQSLEIAITKSAHLAPRSDDGLLTLLRAWAVEALLGGKALSKFKSHNKLAEGSDWEYDTILHFGDNIEALEEEISMETLWYDERLNGGTCLSFTDLDAHTALNATATFWSKPWMLWMALKIKLALTRLGKSCGRWEALYSAPGSGQDWIPGYVDFLEATDLLSAGDSYWPAETPPQQQYASPIQPSVDKAGSVQDVRATQPSESSIYRNSTSNEGHIQPQDPG